MVGGNLQPMTAAGQHEISEAILELASESDTPQLLVLAGLAAGAEDKQIHVICADRDVRKRLEADDIPVTREHPEAGMIGIAGLLISLSTLHSVSTIGLVAETMGASADVVAADRLAAWIEAAFDLPLELSLDSTEKTAARILGEMNAGGDLEETLAMTDVESGDFYV